MSNCNSCVAPSNGGVTHYKIQQLTKLEKGGNCGCKGDKEVDIFPVSVVQAVYDPCSNRVLKDILSDTNHIHLKFKGSFKNTIAGIDPMYKHRGLLVTFTDATGNVVTFRYDGATCHDKQFYDINNWVKLEFIPKWYRPVNLRVEGCSIKLDIENELGTKVETLCAKIMFPEHKCKCNPSPKTKPISSSKPSCSTCVSGMCSVEENEDTSESQEKPQDGGNNTGGTINQEEVQSLKDELKKLSDDLATALDELKKAKDSINELSNRQDISAVSGVQIDDETIRITKSDNTTFDIRLIKKVVEPTVEPDPVLPLEADITAEGLEGFDIARPVFNVEAHNGVNGEPTVITLNGQSYTPGTPIEVTQSGVYEVVVSKGNESVRKSFNVVVTPTTYSLEVSPKSATINRGETATINTRVTSNNPNAILEGFAITFNNEMVDGGRVTPEETTIYSIVAQKDGIRLTGSSTITVIQPTPVETIKYGFTRATSRTDSNRATLDDLTGSTTTRIASFYEVVIPPTSEFTHGFWSVAIPKSMLTQVNQVEIWFNGSYSVLRGGYQVVEEGNYWVIRDQEINAIHEEKIKIS